jgi:hypothetical protein
MASSPDLVENTMTPNRRAGAPIADVLRVYRHRESESAWTCRPVLPVLIEKTSSFVSKWREAQYRAVDMLANGEQGAALPANTIFRGC